MQFYVTWIAALTIAALVVLIPDVASSSDYSQLILAPAFGVVGGGGVALFLRRISNHDI